MTRHNHMSSAPLSTLTITQSKNMFSGSRGVMVNTLDSPCNDPGSIPGSGGATGIWVYYSCGSATSFARDVKQGCRQCTHAFKIMHTGKQIVPACTNALKTECQCGCLQASKLQTVTYVYPPWHTENQERKTCFWSMTELGSAGPGSTALCMYVFIYLIYPL